ncbi:MULTISPECIES: TRAP transporter substrate-binding protein [Comamonadaceae]|uniref:TRAP transporter substrate-binding protein n=1 Tax=Comamonadaceae TaxID=80864 RepID=UPI002733194C|nr:MULTISPECIES: TRAP transporter substrate-binding protein [Comamonadaceae]MDP3190142.1 TRAP transporter substrate-binding protein [Rhodoferax sp.]MDP3888227.1 TRAP transporter substrate-binding protein [Hydrogenophaga sp.]
MNMKLSRRHFLDIAAVYGSRAAFASAALGIVPGQAFLAKEARAQGTAKYKLRVGTIMSETNELHLQSGIYQFAKLVEQKTDGAVQFQIVGSGQACSENTCGSRVTSGVLDVGTSSPQNLGSVFPYSIAMDFPFLWSDRTAYLSFFHSKDSNKLYRDVFRKAYGIELLYGSGEMRNVLLGKKYADKPAIKTFKDFQGAKLRITNSVMIANFMKSIGVNPIPLAWTETLEGLKSGVVDGAETWPGAATGFGMHTVLSHDVPLEFAPGYEVVFMTSAAFNKFPDKIKESILEAAYETQNSAYAGVDLAKKKYIGNGANPDKDSAYVKAGLKLQTLSSAELAEFKNAASIERNAALYSDVRKQLDSVVGLDVYGAMKEAAARYNGKPHSSQKWWA